jgi:hypothetical protein
MARAAWSKVLPACLVLAGCASPSAEMISASSPDQLRMVATDSLCSRHAGGANVTAERQRRGLSDCSQADQSCANGGYRAGSPGYARCRSDLAQQAAARRADGRCYFDTPASGRLAGSIAKADLICSGPANYNAPLPMFVSPQP